MLIEKIKALVNKGNARSVRARKNILVMFALRGASILCSLIVVPLTIDYVSQYEYGIWLTISSLVGWLSFFDFGLGNGLRNKFIEAKESGKYKLARIYVSTAYAIISILVVVVWITGVTAAFTLDWCSILKAESFLLNEIRWTIAIAVTNFSTQFLLGLTRTLLTAVQKPALASSFDTIAQILQIIAILLLVKYTVGSLTKLACAATVTMAISLAACNIWSFTKLLRSFSPSLKFVRFRFAKGIMSLGLLFFFLQVISIAFYQTNNLIISHYIGPDDVTVYNIAYKYTNVLTMVFTILISPFWSAFAEARVNQDYDWMRTTTVKLIKSVGVLVFFGIVMVVISPWIFKIWIGDQIEVSLVITILVCVFQLLNIWSFLWTQLLAAFGKIRLQTIMSTLCVATYLPLGIWSCQRYGLAGLLSASLISLLVFTSWFGIIQVNKLLSKTASGIWNK